MSLVITEDRGAVRHVVLNRPEKRNAMNQELLRELGEALRAAAADVDVQCVVLRGEGPVFSAGVDLGELLGSTGSRGNAAALPPGLPRLRQPVRRDAQAGGLPDPPHCVGGALEVALGCDLRVAPATRSSGCPR